MVISGSVGLVDAVIIDFDLVDVDFFAVVINASCASLGVVDLDVAAVVFLAGTVLLAMVMAPLRLGWLIDITERESDRDTQLSSLYRCPERHPFSGQCFEGFM
jgi:hypothetical protein